MSKTTWQRRWHRLAGRLAPGWAARRAFEQQAIPDPAPPTEAEQDWLDQARALRFGGGNRGWRWGDHGPMVLMLHGWNGRPGQFLPLVAPLRAAGYQVLALAAPGHGPGVRCPAHVLGFARALLRVGAELPPLAAVIGHSMGGAASLLALRQGLDAERVVSLSAPSSLAQALARQADALALPDSARHRFFQAMDLHLGMPVEAVDVAPLVTELALPALVIHDHDDRVVPFAEGERLVSALPRARLLATRGLGHSQALADPVVHQQIQRFLADDPVLHHAQRPPLAA